MDGHAPVFTDVEARIPNHDFEAEWSVPFQIFKHYHYSILLHFLHGQQEPVEQDAPISW